MLHMERKVRSPIIIMYCSRLGKNCKLILFIALIASVIPLHLWNIQYLIYIQFNKYLISSYFCDNNGFQVKSVLMFKSVGFNSSYVYFLLCSSYLTHAFISQLFLFNFFCVCLRNRMKNAQVFEY